MEISWVNAICGFGLGLVIGWVIIAYLEGE